MLTAIPITSRRPLSPALVLLIPILMLGIYLRVIDYPLMRPARVVTEYNGPVNGARPWSRIWTDPTAAHPAGTEDYQPMRQVLLWLEYRAWGASASSYHAMSLLLFLAVVVAYLFFVSRIIHGSGGRAAAGLVLALHPMGSQSILAVEGQGLLLALLMTMLALLEFLRWRRTGRSLGRTALIVTICFIIAVGAHPIGLLLAVWLGLVAWLGPATIAAPSIAQQGPAPKPSRKSTKSGVKASDPVPARSPGVAVAWIALPLLQIAFLYAFIRYWVLGSITPAASVSISEAPAIFATYLERLFVPVSPTLVYSAGSPALVRQMVGLAALLILFIASALLARRRPPLALGILMLLSVLLSLSHLVPLHGFMSEGALLFALPALGLIVGALIDWAAGFESVFPPTGLRGQAIAAFVLLISVALAWQTSARAAQWSTEQKLWEAETALHPQNPLPEIELMSTFGRAGDRDRLLASAARARNLATDPRDIDRINLIEARFYAADKDQAPLKQLLERELDADRPSTVGHLDELAIIAQSFKYNELAEELWRKALTIDPDFFGANYNLAQIEFDRNNLSAAMDFSENAARHATRSQRAIAFTQYAEIMVAIGRPDEAALQFDQALELDPTIYIPYVRLMQIYWGRKDYIAAERVMSQALARASVSSFVDLATMYVSMMNEQGRLAEAMALLGQMIQRYPNDVQLKLLAAHVYVQLGDFNQASRVYQTLTNLTPRQQAEVLVGMGIIALEGNQDRAQAENFWRRSLALDPAQKDARERLVQLGVNPDTPPEKN